MLSPPVRLDICEVLCLTKGGWPPRSCGRVRYRKSQEECIRAHINHVAATRDEAHQMNINTICNFLSAESTGFMSRFKQMLRKSKGRSSWQCCSVSTEAMPARVPDTLEALSAADRSRLSEDILLAHRHVSGQTNRGRHRHKRNGGPRRDKKSRNEPRDPDLSELQYIKDHRIICADDTRYIQLSCCLRDNTNAWVRESTVQEASNAAVCTYWGCGPEEWKRPGAERLLDGIPPEPLRILAYRKADTEVFLQMVGYPASRGQWMSVTDVKAQWCAFYVKCCAISRLSSAQATCHPTGPDQGQRGDLQTIVGHRLEVDDDDGTVVFQLSCQWTSGDEAWEYEADVQRAHNAAVLTYWNSEPEARKAKVPDCYLQFLSHNDARRTVEVQWVGYSACPQDTTWESFCEVKKQWRSEFEKYVIEHSLES